MYILFLLDYPRRGYWLGVYEPIETEGWRWQTSGVFIRGIPNVYFVQMLLHSADAYMLIIYHDSASQLPVIENTYNGILKVVVYW